jgi:Uma2 family endonuclease
MGNAARKRLTVDDWLDLPDEERCEFIDGELIYRSMPSYEHADFQGRLIVELSSFIKKGGGGGPSIGWWITPEISVVYEGQVHGFVHDIAGWRKDKHTEKPRGKKVTVKPDWVCEILSGNKSNDTVIKKWVLHEHRVEYYWIVDLKDKIISVYEWNEKGYICIADARPDEKKSLKPFDTVEFDVAFLFGKDD